MKELEVTVKMAISSGGGSSVNGGVLNTQASNQDDIEAKTLVNKRGEDGEYESTRNLDSRQMLQQQKQMLKDQDQHLDQIGGIVSNLRYEN
jgi:hypothetical protein